MKLRLIKLGGSLITDKRRSRTVRRAELDRICSELAEVLPRARTRTVLGHGSGSFGHVTAARHRVQEGLRGPARRAGVSATQGVAAELHRIVCDQLRSHGLAPFSYSPSSGFTASSGRISTLPLAPLTGALEGGLLPVTHGDVVIDRVRGACIASTETVLVALARRLQRRGYTVSGAYWFGDTDGIYDEAGETVARVRVGELFHARRLVGGSAGTDVTGGMRHRLESAATLARIGIPSLIANGCQPGLVRAALRGERVDGTRVEP